jgi:hypothetical protein
VALDHRSKIYAARECRIAKMTADLATPLAAPSVPGTPTLSVGTAGVLTYTYAVVAYTPGSADSALSATVTSALCASGSSNTVTFAVAVPAGQIFKVIRTVAPAGISTGVVGYAAAGATTFLDSNLPAITYVANTTGTTYGISIPLPGIKAVKVTGTVNTVDLRGDNTFLDTDSMLSAVAVELDHAKVSLDALNVMMGGVVVDSGVTPNQQSTWALLNPPPFGYFKIEARSASADPALGDFHILMAKVKLADFPTLGLVEENYQLFNLKCKAVPPIGGGNWMSVVLNETAAACAA